MPEISSKAAVIKEAQKYLAKGQIDKAIATWEKLIKENPDANTYNALGDLYLKNHDKRNAVDSFHKAAKFFMNEGFSLKALGLYKKILNINPSDADAFYALGEINEERGLAIDAIKYYLSAADSLSKEGKKEKLFNIYDKIIAISPSNIPFRMKVAEIYTREGLNNEAAREYYHIAKIYEEKGDLEKTLEYLQKSLFLSPSNKEVMLGIANLYEKTGKLEEAIDQISEFTSLLPQDPDIHLRCSEIYSKTGRFDEAMTCLNKVIELEPANFKAIKLLGEIYIRKGDREKAWAKYLYVLNDMTIEMNPEDAIQFLESFKDIDPIETGKRLVSLYRQRGENLKVLQELISLGDAYTAQSLLNEALNSYKEALLITPDNASLTDTVTRLEKEAGIAPVPAKEEKSVEESLLEADVFIKYGLFNEAENLLKELYEKDPENIDLHEKLKTLYISTDNKEQTVAECLTLCDLYDRAGNAEKKKQVMKEAYEIYPEDPRLLEREELSVPEETRSVPSSEKISTEDYSEELAEADFYAKQGLVDEARDILQKLHKLFPENEELEQKLDSLNAVAETYREPLSSEVSSTEKEAIHEPVLDGDILNIFNEFKKGLEKEIEDKDHETHYNLGIAYKELGLIDEAIKEFQVSRNDPKNFVSSSSMLSICYQEKHLYPLAIEVLRETLERMENRDESYWAIKYDLADAYEKNGDLKEASHAYAEVNIWNPEFREVSERIRQIEAKIQKKPDQGKSKDKEDRISYL